MPTISSQTSRRTFLTSAAALTAGLATPAHTQTTPHQVETMNETTFLTGNGQWSYKKDAAFGLFPEGQTFGGTHGGIATDNDGNVYVSTQSQTGIIVYDSNGKFLRTIAHDFPEVHSMVHAEENGAEYFYTTVQHGTPKENWLFVKMKTDGTPVLKITAPREAGFKLPNDWRITSAIPAPDGDIWIANGYGDSRLFRFDKNGNFKKSYAGKGDTDGLFKCNHGIAVDTRYDQPLMLVCDRENRRMVHMDFDGKFVSNVTFHLRRPCQASFYGDHVVISELEGRATILDRDNVPVAFLGDNPDKTQWAKYDLSPELIKPASFSASHGCYVDKAANIYISDWNKTGRVIKLERLSA
jgi:peptidylamidoglycolate lyase